MAETVKRYPRLRLNIRVRLHGMYMLTNNISLTGAQLSCPAMKYEVIRGKLSSGTAPAEIIAGDDRLPLEAEVMYASDYGDEFLLGVAFRAWSEGAEQKFRDYLIAQAGPSAVQLEESDDG